MNTLDKAEKAIEGQRNVPIGTYQDKERVVIEIRDHNRGIRTEYLSEVFCPFFATKHVGEGTGLGLSIAYGIVEGHGGTIMVESEKGKGATFAVSIPAQKEVTGQRTGQRWQSQSDHLRLRLTVAISLRRANLVSVFTTRAAGQVPFAVQPRGLATDLSEELCDGVDYVSRSWQGSQERKLDN